MKTKVQQGFTLIELMIVIAIIGMLAAVAVPAYKDYTIRASMSEVVGIADQAKTSVAEFATSQGHWPANNSSAGLPVTASYATPNIGGLRVNGSLIAIAALTHLGLPAAGSLGYVGHLNASNNQISWTCKAGQAPNGQANVTNIPPKYLPAVCR